MKTLQYYIDNNLNIVNVLFAILEVLFLIILATVIVGIIKEEPVNLLSADTNIDLEIEGASDVFNENIAETIYDLVSLNTKNDKNIDISELSIRDNSLTNKQIGNTGMRHLNFIVDIPALRQSYRVYYDYYLDNESSGGAPEILVTCLQGSDEVIYEDFQCKDGYGDLGKYYVVNQYSASMGPDETQDAGDYRVYLPGDKRYDGKVQKEAYVEITAYCSEVDAEKKAVDKVSSFFKELGFNLDDFKYEVVTECEYYDESEQ